MRERMATHIGIESISVDKKSLVEKKKEEKLEDETKRIPRVQRRECDRFARSVAWNNTLMAVVLLDKVQELSQRELLKNFDSVRCVYSLFVDQRM